MGLVMMGSWQVVQFVRERAGIRWRLVSRNGRVIAASAGHFVDADAAIEALDHVRLIAREAAFQLTLAHPASSIAWIWSVRDPHGTDVSCGVHTYARQGACLDAYRRFVDLAGALEPRAGSARIPG